MRIGCVLLALLSVAAQAGPKYQLAPLTVDEEVQGKGSEEIEEQLHERLDPKLAEWNRDATGQLVTIQPIIDDIHYVHVASRILFGPLPRSSHVVMRVKITGAGLNEEKSFREDVGAWKGAVGFGHHDAQMLDVIVDEVIAYITSIHDAQSKSGPASPASPPRPEPQPPPVPSPTAQVHPPNAAL